VNPAQPATQRPGYLGVWLCYGVEPNRLVADVPPGYRFPLTLSVPFVSLEGLERDNAAACRRGDPCDLEIFVRDDELTAMHGIGRRVFYTFDRMTRRTLTPRERAALQ